MNMIFLFSCRKDSNVYSRNLLLGKLEHLKRNVVNDQPLIYIYLALDQGQFSNYVTGALIVSVEGDYPKLKEYLCRSQRDNIVRKAKMLVF